MAKDVVVVTWKGEGNFGTCLQSYALNKILDKLGYQVKFLPSIPEYYSVMLDIKWFFKCLGLKKLKDAIKKRRMTILEKKRAKFHNKAYNEIVIYTKWQEKRLVSHTDCFITGSDQIWNTFYNFSPFYFLSFVGSCKRVAYASSIGTNSVKEDYKNAVRELLHKFNHIGVREKEAVRVLTDLTGRSDIIQVVDPTFLLSPNDWRELASNAEYEKELPEEYIFCYLIGNNPWYKDYLKDVHSIIGIKNIIIIPSAENPDFSCEGAITYQNASPIEFVDLLQKAKFVCTDSFHATALSINYSVPFVEFLRFKDDDMQSQNSRIYDLLNHYGLMERIYHKESSKWKDAIDYLSVQDVLSCDRQKSMDYLVNAIEH